MSQQPFLLDVLKHSSFTFTQIKQMRIAAGIDTETHYAVGHPDPQARTTTQQRAMFEFSTPQLKTLLSGSLANVGVRGNSSDNLSGTLINYLKKKTTIGSVARGTTQHKSLTLNKWHMFWSQITLSHRQTSEASVTVNAVYDTSNDPIVYANGVALPGSLTAAEQFGCGPASINGTSISELIEEIQVSSGVKLMQLSGCDIVWDTYCATEMTDTVVTIKCKEPVNWSTLGLAGGELDGTSGLEFYARRKGPNGPVANATSSHIYFIGASGRYIPVDTSGSGSSETTDTLRVELNAPDSSTLALLGTVDSAIT